MTKNEQLVDLPKEEFNALVPQQFEISTIEKLVASVGRIRNVANFGRESASHEYSPRQNCGLTESRRFPPRSFLKSTAHPDTSVCHTHCAIRILGYQ